jgi:hypothetical protein
MKNGISSGSSVKVDELRLQSCSPLCFFAAGVASAEAVLEVIDDDEEEEEEDDEEVVLGKVGINFAFGSTFNSCL